MEPRSILKSHEATAWSCHDWKSRAAGTVVYCAALWFLFHDLLSAFVNRWSNEPQYSHGFAIPVMAAWLGWYLRDRISVGTARSCRWGLIWIVGSIVLHVASVYLFVEVGYCAAILTEGEECSRQDACLSSNCGVPANGSDRQCLVAIGDQCTNDNCEVCLGYGDYCTEACGSDDSCPSGMRCAGRDDNYLCRQDCTGGGSCPDHCEAYSAVCEGNQRCLPVTGMFGELEYYACFE